MNIVCGDDVTCVCGGDDVTFPSCVCCVTGKRSRYQLITFGTSSLTFLLI